MFERFGEQVVVSEPACGFSAPPRHAAGLTRLESTLQKVAEQMVIAIPLPVLVERDQKQPRRFDFGEKAGSVLVTRHCVRQRRADTTQTRRRKKKFLHLW